MRQIPRVQVTQTKEFRDLHCLQACARNRCTLATRFLLAPHISAAHVQQIRSITFGSFQLGSWLTCVPTWTSSEIRPMWECGVCFEGYNEQQRRPLVLPCGHTLCQACVFSLQQQRCPECKCSLNGRRHNLPTNIAVLRVSQFTRKAKPIRVAQLAHYGWYCTAGTRQRACTGYVVKHTCCVVA